MPLSSRHRRIAVTVAAAAALAAVAFVLVAASHEARPTAGLRASPEASAVVPPTTPPPIEIVSARDPFSPPPALDAAPVPDGDPIRTPSPIGQSAEPPQDASSPAPTTVPPTTPSPPPPSCEGAPRGACYVAGGHVVELARVTRRHGSPLADLAVDDHAYTNVADHDRFARRFRLVGFSDRGCAQIVFRREGFTLCAPGP